MQLVRIVLAAALAFGASAGADAGSDKKPVKTDRPPIIINDPSAFRAPPPPHERNYVGPGPSLAPPMERIPQVPPLAQPPVR